MINKTGRRQLRQTLSLYVITAFVACSALAAPEPKQQFFPPHAAVRQATSSQRPVVVNAASFLP
ncbi:MAG: hypothetical protein M3Y27_04260, partial [Acidobacteriota bacterium]|nr:hypothetical protein [Acidobacteriota bacterium]